MRVDKRIQHIVQDIAKGLPTHDAMLRTLAEQHQIIESKSTVIDKKQKRIAILNTSALY